MHFSHLGSSLNVQLWQNQALAFATIHEQPFPLRHCRGIGDIPTVASVAQTYDRLRRMVPVFPSKTNSPNLLYDVQCVGLNRPAERPQASTRCPGLFQRTASSAGMCRTGRQDCHHRCLSGYFSKSQNLFSDMLYFHYKDTTRPYQLAVNFNGENLFRP